jgi:predicted transcriptional regulator of viral defense system
VKAGNFDRVERGLFRLPAVPPAEHDDLIRLSLWSRGRDDLPQAVISHETALAVHGLGDLLPMRTHMIVPRSFRKPAPRGCVLHKAELKSDEIEERDGFRITNALRTVLDVARTSGVTQEQLDAIVKEAITGGLVRLTRLLQLAKQVPANPRLAAALDVLGT